MVTFKILKKIVYGRKLRVNKHCMGGGKHNLKIRRPHFVTPLLRLQSNDSYFRNFQNGNFWSQEISFLEIS